MSYPQDASGSPRLGARSSQSQSTLSQPDHSKQSTTAIAEQAIRRDLEEDSLLTSGVPSENDLPGNRDREETILREHSLIARHRRPSYVAAAPRAFLGVQPETEYINPGEQDPAIAIQEERDLLVDNELLQDRNDGNEASNNTPTETTALLNADPEAGRSGEADAKTIDQKWEDAVLAGQIQTTWQREAKVIGSYCTRLIITFLLQQSLTFTSVFTAGHLGKNELAAVSLGVMTAVITGYSVYYGLATSLDTMCAQAYGSGRKKLVGLYLQRNVYFLWACTVPIAVVWFFSPQILARIVPEKDIAVLSGRYLRVLILGAPGFAAFESAKRYVQAQGRFTATLCVLICVAPANVLMQYVFVWVSSCSLLPKSPAALLTPSSTSNWAS